jgi:hypothetical protein
MSKTSGDPYLITLENIMYMLNVISAKAYINLAL